ncbi:MAG: hypothetical protein N838_16525 [Thiohalocapsa sp. PB-PSB1]|nr:MAG: hypothetical protein N838_16525 [Thiohalocapsa sp. PB-PSB1]
MQEQATRIETPATGVAENDDGTRRGEGAPSAALSKSVRTKQGKILARC